MSCGDSVVTPIDSRDWRGPDIHPPESSFLTALFWKLHEEEIRYCVLRNYEGLPFDIGDGDLDVHVEHSRLSEAAEIVSEVASKYGGKSISFSKWRAMRQLCMCGSVNGAWWGIRLDILSMQTYKGVVFYPSEELLRTARSRRGVWIACPSHSATVALLKDALSTGRVRSDYLQGVQVAYRESTSEWTSRLANLFGPRAARLLSQFVEDPASVSFSLVCRSLRSGLALRAMMSRPVHFLWDRLTSLRDRGARVFKRPGVCVAVMGTDGSGKSTVIDAVCPVLQQSLHTKPLYEHLRPNLLPSLATVFGRPVSAGPVTNPHGSKPSGFWGSLLRLCYYSTDYILGYWLKVFPTIVKSPCLYIFDRYFYDYYIDPRRSRIALPRWIVRAFSWLVPKPDVILCLGADPKIVHERKPELPLAEIERQMQALRRFCDRNNRAVWIDTGCSVEKSVDQALEAVTARMAARYSRAIIPDERAVSWKVLLPQGPEDKVLALGVDATDLSGLRRTFPRLDTTPASSSYDLVVIGKGEDIAASNHYSIAALIKEKGVLVTIGKTACGDYHNGIGLFLCRNYAPLPTEHPRVFVPLHSRRATLEGLSLHTPGSSRAQATLFFAKALRRLGLQWHLRRKVINFYRCANSSLDTCGLLAWLSQSLGYSLTDLVIYTGSESRRRKITALALADHGHADVIVKIADNPQGAEAIRQESEALKALAGSLVVSNVPRVLLGGQYNNYTIQVQTKAFGKRHRQIARLTGGHFRFLSQLSMVSRRQVKMEDTKAWNHLKVAAESPLYGEIPGYAQVVLKRILSEECAQAMIVCHRTHGDFAPWNIRAKRNAFFVFDWEDSEPTGFPFTDLFHFLYRQASLIGPWRGAGRLLAEMKKAATILSQSAGLRRESLEILLPIWAIQERLAHPSDHIEEVLRQVTGGS